MTSPKRFVFRWIVFTLAPVVLLLSTSLVRAESHPNIFYKGWLWNDTADAVLGIERVPARAFQENYRFDAIPSYPFRVHYPPIENTVTRTGMGTYRLRFPNLGVHGGTVLVSAYGGSHHCKVAGWGPSGADMLVNINCYDGAGPVNGRFTTLLYKNGDSKPDFYGNAYLWADRPAASECYEPASLFQFNSRSVRNRVCRLGAGEYDVRLPELAREPADRVKGGTVQVTAYGGGAGRCVVRRWREEGRDVIARVGCTTATGPMDAMFTLSFLRDPGALANQFAEDKAEGFYVWADRAPIPTGSYQSDSYGGEGATMEGPSAERPGHYVVHLPGVAADQSTALVTAYDSSTTHCTISRWAPEPAGTKVEVQCFTGPGGPAVNAKFVLFYATNNPILF